MPDWAKASKAAIRLAGLTGAMANVHAIDASIDLLRALTSDDEAESQVLKRLERLEGRDFEEGVRLLENARDSEPGGDYWQQSLMAAVTTFNRALSIASTGVDRTAVLYHSALAHMMLGEDKIARRDLKDAREIDVQLQEFDGVLATELLLDRQEEALRARYWGERDASITRRLRTGLFTTMTYRFAAQPVRKSLNVWQNRDKRRYLRSQPAIDAKAYFGVDDRSCDVDDDIRALAAAVVDAAAAVE